MLAHPSQHAQSGDSPPVTAQVELTGLGNRFIGLLGRKWSRRSFAAELAKLLADATRAKAVAVQAYEWQRDRLMLGGAAETVWDIPLRGLRNRRISVIEAAHQNPLVPPSLRQFCPEGLCIVSLPLYYNGEPVGAVVLFAARSRAFSDAQLQTLSQALRVCGRGLREQEPRPARIPSVGREEVGSEAERTAGTGLRAAASAPEAAGEVAHGATPHLRLVEGDAAGVASVQSTEAPLNEAQRAAHDLARTQAEMQRRNDTLRSLMSASRAIKAERDHLRQQVAELEHLRASETAELRQQLGHLEDRLLAVESERQRAQRLAEGQRRGAEQALQALQTERDTLRGRVDAAESSTAEAGTRVSVLSEERDNLAAQLDHARGEVDRLALLAAGLREELSASQAAAAASDERRSRLAERDQEVARLRAETAAADQSSVAAAVREAALTAELAQVRTQIEPLFQAVAERDSLVRATAGLKSKLSGSEDVVASLRQQVAAAQTEGGQSAQRAAALLAELETIRRGHEETVAAAAHEIRQAAVRDETMQRQADELRQQLGQLDAVLRTVSAERDGLKQGLQAAEAAAAAAAAESDELRRAVHDAVRRLEQERLEHASELDTLLEESAPDAPRGAPAGKPEPPLSFQSSPEEALEVPAEDSLTIERSAPLTPVTEAAEGPLPTPQPKKAGSLGELVVLDQGLLAEQACAALAAAGFEVTAPPLGEATVDALAQRNLKCIMLNLGAGAGAWRTLRTLRERAGTRHVPILAYVMNEQAPTGFCFGRVDFALWPLEPGRLLERLGRLRPKLQRLLIVSADVEGMGGLREPLARAKISTSIVLDAKQALEFAAMIEPDAAIVHLSPNCPSGARAITGLRANESTRDLPVLVLLDAANVTNEEAFFTNAGRQLLARTGFQFSRLPEEIGRLIG